MYPRASSLDPTRLQSALDLARTLAEASAEIARITGIGTASPSGGGDRGEAVAIALRVWLGPHRRSFEQLYANETESARLARRRLAEEADAWARFWADATNARIEREHEEALEVYRARLVTHRERLERHRAATSIAPELAAAVPHPGPRPLPPSRPDAVPVPSAAAGYRPTG